MNAEPELDLSPLERIRKKNAVVRNGLIDWMREQGIGFSRPCPKCLASQEVNLDASVMETIRNNDFRVVWFKCRCQKPQAGRKKDRSCPHNDP